MKRFQNRIAESSLTLPVMLLLFSVAWALTAFAAAGWHRPSVHDCGSLVCQLITAYLLVELSTAMTLLRVRSNLVTASLLAMTMASGPLMLSFRGSFVTLCFLGFLSFLLSAYQDDDSPGTNFYAFLLLGIGSMGFVHILYIVPIVWLLMTLALQSMSWRTWGASVLGVLTPYWFLLCYTLFTDELSLFADIAAKLTEWQWPPVYSGFGPLQSLLFVLMVVVSLSSIVHFIVTGYEDKIRTRQYLAVFATLAMVLLAFIVLQPQHSVVCFHLAFIPVGVLAAHFFALTSSRITNVAFIIVLILLTLICVVNGLTAAQ